MRELLSAAGRGFLRAFVAGLLVYGPGISQAPSLHAAYLLGVAALIAAFAAGLRAIQAYVPQVAAATHLGKPYGDWVDSFAQGFIASLIVTLPGITDAPDFSTGRALLVGAILGAVNAGIRAVQGTLTTGEHPSPGTGVNAPPPS